ncbi:uncharacterized protein LOC117178182 isoform X2 [Belonocnema kinseyi]|uniref:uncharacterized protein LOC117178182 isoform X2 n=1 Tax=Belonocnema kinseyi TaxID=2817044 RepID=UPI00143DBC85|nr:uncharacterized protein LOC117178182 isoform X2 [Belonocnema kinseyi]
MATLKPKAKSKKPGRPSKTEARNYDLSNLRPPFKTSISNLKEVVKLFEDSTPEIKDLLTHEVNILYECRICGSIYRSLLNIVSHKRVFCKEKVNITTEKKSRDDQSSNVTCEEMQTLDLDESTFDMLDKPTKNARILRSQAPRKPQKKDLTSVVHMLQRKQEENLDDEVKQKHTAVQRKKDGCDQVVLQVMESKLAAFQTLVEPNLSPVDLMENQVMELNNISNQDTVTLGTDGLIEKSDSPVHFYNNDQDIDKLICETCHRTFSTRKMLNSHMKTLHAPVRVTFLCPLCPQDNLGTPASVIRHLTNAHKKIGKELKELSERIEERIVKTKLTPTVPHKKTKKPGNSCKNTGGESQEWIDRLEPQEFQDCSLCGERFGCKEEFMTHSENCIGQSDVRSPEEIEAINQDLLDNDDCEVVSSVEGNFVALTSPEEQKTDSSTTSEIIVQPRIQHISSLNLEDWNNLPQSFSQNEECSNREITLLEKPNRPVITDSRILDDPEILFPLDNTKKRKASSLLEINGQSSQGERWKKPNREQEIAHAESGRKSVQNLEKKICQAKLECFPCKRSFTSLSSFKRHVDSHIKLNRYQCNKCDYKSVTRNDCIGHCNRMHNGMNNRQVLNEMISTIPQNQLAISQEIDLSNLSSNNVSRSFSDVESRIRSMTPVANLRQKQHNRAINLSDTETETEDGDSARKIDLRPLKSAEILEIIGGSNSDPLSPKSNINILNLSHIQNNNLKMSGQVFENSPELEEINYNASYPAEEDEITGELCPRSRSRMETRSSSRLGKKLDSDYEDEITPELPRAKSRNSMRSLSRTGTMSEPRCQKKVSTRSRSRTGNQSDSCVDLDENQDDIWKGYSQDLSTEEPESRSFSRQSRGKRRGRPPGRAKRTRSISRERKKRRGYFSSEYSQMQRPMRNCITARSRSCLGGQSDSYFDIEANQADIWKGYSRDLNAEEPESRSLSRQSRGKRRGRPPGRGRRTRSISRERKERSGYFGRESPHMQRPVRNRIKPIDKDFVYDMGDDDPFHRQLLSYSPPRDSSGRITPAFNQFVQNRLISPYAVTKRLFDETDDLEFIREIPSQRMNATSDLESAEPYFKGFPKRAPIMNVE